MSGDGSRVAISDTIRREVRVFGLGVSQVNTPNPDGSITSTTTYSWSQIANTISFDTNRSTWAVAISKDGGTIAVGAAVASGSSVDEPGRVRIYRQYAQGWDLYGQELTGFRDRDQFGYSLALSADGTTLLVGYGHNENFQVGRASVFEVFTSGSGSALWQQVGGEIEGDRTRSGCGVSVDLSSDGRKFVLGCPMDGGGAGYAGVFTRSGSSWIWDGEKRTSYWILYGEANSGERVSASDNLGTIVVASPHHDVSGNEDMGTLRVYSSLLDGGFVDMVGQARFDFFGSSTAVSGDGSTFAVGVPQGSDTLLGGSGLVQVFRIEGSTVVQLGGDITFPEAWAEFGAKIDITDNGERVIIGYNCPNSINSPRLRCFEMYEYTGSDNTNDGTGGDNPSTCFSGQNTVDVQGKGTVGMEELSIGDFVKIGDGSFSRVFSFMHRAPELENMYVSIHTSHNRTLEISSDHIFYVRGGPVPASSVSIGDPLNVAGDVVTHIERVPSQGLYAPVTVSGDIMVSGLHSSCYVAILPEVSPQLQLVGTHFLLSPLRMACALDFDLCVDETYSVPDGYSNFIFWAVRLCMGIRKCHRLVQLAALFAALPMLGVLYFLEQLFQRPILGCSTVGALVLAARRGRSKA